MIQQFHCSNGMVFAAADSYYASVDDVIDFLEQFRGMTFYHGASGDVAFRLDGNTIICESLDAQIQRAYDEGNHVGELVEAFFQSGEESTTETEWRHRITEKDQAA